MVTNGAATHAGETTPPAQTQVPKATPPAVVADPVAAGLQSISTQLQRRGYLTTEWWTAILGTGVTLLLAYLRPGDAAAPQTAAIIAPALLAAAYSVSRTMHKSALADVLQAALPQISSPTEAL